MIAQSLTSDAFCLARQAIADRELNLVGYELLYRQSNYAQVAQFDDPVEASARVYSLALLDLGAAHLGSGFPISLNVPQFWLERPELFPEVTSKVILEILEDTVPNEKVFKALEQLSAKGYTIALDDFTLTQETHPLIQYAKWIKLDTHQYSKDELAKLVAELKAYPVKLVAEKIETWQEFKDLEEMGFDYFQGFFLSRPRIFRGSRAHSNQQVLMDLIQQLYQEAPDIDQLVDTVIRDPGLTYRLLRHINSAGYMFNKEITSIHQAVMLLGQERLRSMVSLLLWSKSPFKASSQLPTILVRAKACEAITQHYKLPEAKTSFTVGVLSSLHIALGMDFNEMISQLKVESIITEAFKGRGTLGEVLRLVIAYEKGDWDAMEKSRWYKPEVNTLFIQSIEWADEVYQQMGLGTLL
ncbi:EAL and modified HD-GYP domain-containing signal transduction protein [Oceanospirillum multiglobuliferum]|uniref:HDOD domain-containing protein n=1 Tax=Oceanospirillum multiglobuliferum TaxID=64969 RepID=A0A1T4M566_9GAMM|nr:HDOD domain-containing protein [Oceanospirillum multiglobuliferum]OPX56247.1 hypothetical protein BTE48_04535 [Oceanospirillum multiglobuliferum]SJZ61928.1 EAL and modified HD-GYP domain-containing signal transduction protein [Oceanospirillum multiglobuliferum]